MKLFSMLLVVAFASLLPRQGFAQLIHYEFEGACVGAGLTCGDFGLLEGEIVTGALAFDPAVRDPDLGRFSLPVVEFELNVGNLTIGIDDLGSTGRTPSATPSIGASVNTSFVGDRFDSFFNGIPTALPGDPAGRQVALDDVEISAQDEWRIFDVASPQDRIVLDGDWSLVDPIPPVGAFDGLEFVFNTTTIFDGITTFPVFAVGPWDPFQNASRDFFTAPLADFTSNIVQTASWAESYDLIELAPNGLVYVLGNNLGFPLIREFDPATGAFAGRDSGFEENDFFVIEEGQGFPDFIGGTIVAGVIDWEFTEDDQVLLMSGAFGPNVTDPFEPQYITRVRLADDEVTGSFEFPSSEWLSGLLYAGNCVAYASVLGPAGDSTLIQAIDLEASFQAGASVVLETIVEVDGLYGGKALGPDGEIYATSSSDSFRGLSRIDPNTGLVTEIAEGRFFDLQFVGDRLFIRNGLTLFEFDPDTGQPLWPVVRPIDRELRGFAIFNTVPEPGAAALMVLGLASGLLRRATC